MKKVNGNYFTYCQWCEFDGKCELRHNEFMGVESSRVINKTPYPGHEGVDWHLSGFQRETKRASCSGKICVSGSIFYPLLCECGTAISSLGFTAFFDIPICAKFKLNVEARKKIKEAKSRGAKWIDLAEILEIDLHYEAFMIM